jgi:hypothetical protein
MAIESLVRKKYFLTSEQSECFASLSIEWHKLIKVQSKRKTGADV